MKNITKYIVVALTAMSFSVAQAGTLEITGSAKASLATVSSDSSTAALQRGKALGVTNEFSLGASGELDNGYTWNYAQDIDGTTVQDDAKLTLTTPYGTVGVFVSEGGLDSDNAASQSVVSRPSDTSYNEGMFDSFDISSQNTLQLHSPAGLLPYETKIRVAYAPANDSGVLNDYKATGTTNEGTFTVNSATAILQDSKMGTSAYHYRVDSTPMEGMTVGADYVEFKDVKGGAGVSVMAQEPASGSAYITYVYGPASIGISTSRARFALNNATDDFIKSVEARKISGAFNVNDQLSVSYEAEESNPANQNVHTLNYTMKARGIQAAYTMGGMTLAIARNTFENAAYTKDNDVVDTVFSVAMAF